MENKISKWILAWMAFIAFAPLMFGVLGYLNPSLQGGEGAAMAGLAIYAGPLGLYIARNIATGIVTGFSLVKRSADMITLALILRIATDIIDLLNAFVSGVVGVQNIIIFCVFALPSTIALVALNRKA